MRGMAGNKLILIILHQHTDSDQPHSVEELSLLTTLHSQIGDHAQLSVDDCGLDCEMQDSLLLTSRHCPRDMQSPIEHKYQGKIPQKE